MIPKKIHYCWFGGHEMPPLNQACFDTWKKHLEDYEFVRWDESNYPKNAFTEYHIQQGNWAFVSDYVRLYALYTEGGIYLDTDFEVLKPFDDLLDNKAFLAWESEEHITNGIAGSIPEHIFFKDCMDYMMDRHLHNQDYQISPVVTTNVFNSKEYEIKIYENRLFYPYNPYDPKKMIKILMLSMITDETYAIHHWAKSWELETSEAHQGTGLCTLARTALQKICNMLTKIIR